MPRPQAPRPCECGCGAFPRRAGSRFLAGHNRIAEIPPVRERLFSRLIIDGNGCLLWAGTTNIYGYGVITIDSRSNRLVHRVMWELLEGPIPAGLTLDHLCHNADPQCAGGKSCVHRRCANLAHLEVVTTGENSLRGRALAAVNAAKTHCDSGHPYDEANTYYRPHGGRSCRACRREYQRKGARPVGEVPHGRAGYNNGCRCEVCSTAQSLHGALPYARRNLAAGKPLTALQAEALAEAARP